MARDKKAAFERLSESRLSQGDQFFKLMENMANPYNYQFTGDQLQAILSHINGRVHKLTEIYTPFIDGTANLPKQKKNKELKAVTEKIVSAVKETASSEPEQPIQSEPEEIDPDIPDFLRKKA